MIDVRPIEDFLSLSSSSWNALLEKTENPLPFQRYEWSAAWWKNFSSDKLKLLILLAEENDRLLGIAPLMYRRYIFTYSVNIKFIGTGFFDYFGFIIQAGREKEVLEGFLNYICAQFKSFELQLNNIFQDSNVLKLLSDRNLFKNVEHLIFPEEITPCINLPLSQEIFSHQISGSLRYDLRRKEKGLARLGKIEFRECLNKLEAQETLEDLFALHIRKWEADSGYSVYKFEKRRDFLRDLLALLWDEKIVNLYYLSLNNKKIAVCFAFEINHRILYYNFAHDPEFARYSPGKILLSRLISHAIAKPHKEFDFGIGREAYKLKWPVKFKSVFNICIYPRFRGIVSLFLKSRRIIINMFFKKILPELRRFRMLVSLWRYFKRKSGNYMRK